MSESAVFVGGLPALLGTLVIALFALVSIPRDMDGMRWRVAGFIVFWQTFTPIMPWYLDFPLWIFSLLAMEFLYRAFKFGRPA